MNHNRVIFTFIILVLYCSVPFAQDMTAQVKLVATSSFVNSTALLGPASDKDVAVLPTPNEKNQFLIFDLQKRAAVSEISFLSDGDTILPEDVVIYSGENILQWQKVSEMVRRDGRRYSATVLPNAGQYFKITFGARSRSVPLKISSFRFIRSEGGVTQAISNIMVPDEGRKKTSVVIEYTTMQPSVTYVVYGTNFDYLYTNKMENIYSDLTPKTKHRVVLSKLTPKVTYVYQIIARDINDKEYPSRTLYFSTK